ncbi:MAG: 16S rRNA (cytosine(1402)-N(4))-methyltransferase RsmH [Gemmatimonadales bacterium]|jgi:16S rRNA (cytosine1402-N4)-methyltransferase|nr:16S rRNA (cytosine(1402)-N(4))-methyltransferase RsmH [Gemmatimonadales bacterium]
MMHPDPAAPPHEPVLLAEILRAARGARRVVDATVGFGGHAAALAAQGAELLVIDRDAEALAWALERLGALVTRSVAAPFDDPDALAAIAAFGPDFILLDLGVSSRQLDVDARGFSFREGAPLDMRMERAGETAAEWLARADATELARAFRDYGDERRATALAREIVRRRARGPMRVADDLVNAIRAVLGPRSGPGDFARLFQAVRIVVNDELGRLARALPAMRDALVPGGTLAVISYHSGEDRVVKQAFRAWGDPCTCPPGLPVCICGAVPRGREAPRGAIVAADDEVQRNPRARSAKLRIFRVNDAA